MVQIQRTGAAGAHARVLVCGPGGSGKTRFCVSWPNPILATTESLLDSVRKEDIPMAKIESSADLKELIVECRKSPDERKKAFGVPVDTFYLDTVDQLQRVLQGERLAATGRSDMEGKDYGWLGDEMRRYLSAIRNLPMHVVLTCHVKDREVNNVTLGQPALVGALRDEINEFVSIAGVLESQQAQVELPDGSVGIELRRWLRTMPDTRYEWLKDHSGNLPGKFDVNFQDDFERLSQLVFEIPPMPVASVATPPDPDLVALQSGATENA